MPVSLRRGELGVCAFFCALALSGAVAAGAQEPPRFQEDKAIDVEVKIVPFYAVDEEGRPVYDLKQEEVEIRVGGAPVALQSFDRYAISGEGSQPRAGSSAPPAPRNVFFLFDVGFSSPAGLDTSRRLATGLVENWPGTDRLHLLVNTQAGMESRLGPLAADRQGKRSLLTEIQSLKPEVRRLHLGLDDDFGPTVGSIGGAGVGSQMEHNYDAMRGSARGEHHSAAKGFAESLESLAGDLRRLSGPKLLLIFSQGVDPELYFDGDTGNGMGSDESIRITSRRAPPLLDRFKGPLDALTDSGTLALFVNATQDSVLENAMRHMARTTGGLYLDGVDRRGLERRIAASTAAYYEAGFQPTGPLLAAARGGVEVVVRRPGVKAWAPAAVRTRETYRGLNANERKMLVIDLVSGGPEAQRARGPVRLDTRDLAGRPMKGGDTTKRSLRFDIDWPRELATRKFDVYNVVLASSGKGQKARIVQFDEQKGMETSAFGALEAAFESGDDSLWGIVAIDPETDRAWFRRLRIQPESAKK